jgi:hypothetical protein
MVSVLSVFSGVPRGGEDTPPALAAVLRAVTALRAVLRNACYNILRTHYVLRTTHYRYALLTRITYYVPHLNATYWYYNTALNRTQNPKAHVHGIICCTIRRSIL